MAQVLKDSVRERILLAAERCFAREGARRATMGGIAEEAGVATGSIYTYFPNKQALFEAVVPEEFVREFQRLTRRRIADFEQPGAFMPGFEPGLAGRGGFDGSAGPAGPLGPTGPAESTSAVSLSKPGAPVSCALSASPAAPVGAVSLFKPGAPVSRVLPAAPGAPVGARLAESTKAANIVLPAGPAAAVTPGPDGSGDPLDPAAHVAPADADDDTSSSTNSIDPIDATGPTSPSDPGEPSDPSDSGGPSKPSDPPDLGAPSKPSELTDSGDPGAPGAPSDPGGLIEPSAPDELSASGKPSDPTGPSEPSGPTGPSGPSAPSDPARGNSKLPAPAVSARRDSKLPAQAADARTASYVARAAVPETPESAEDLLRFWLANRLRTVILLDRAEGTRHEHFGREYVQNMFDQALEQAERQFPGLTRDELFRFLARGTLAESVRGMVAILERYEDEATLRQAFAAATACRLAAIQALVAWALARRSE